jgi:LemA protein
MNNKWIIVLVIVAIIVVGIVFVAMYYGTYNNLVSLEVSVDEKWAQVEQELQRRYDLIPRVVNASKLYINYEGSILQNVTELRSQWAAAMNSGDLDAINDATGQLDSAVTNLVVTIEAYPDLKASQVVEDLIVELEEGLFRQTYGLLDGALKAETISRQKLELRNLQKCRWISTPYLEALRC